ncbi:hypothetical protein nACB2_017 [Acinetobacter phage nACB2]|nr:hypothetical protein nACB2_017 [Acinetobacter phage nACB2]
MTKLTENQKIVLNALIGTQTFANQRWTPTSTVAERCGLSKLVVAGVMCSLINKGLVVSMKTKEGSVYEFTLDGNATLIEELLKA